MQVQMQTFGGVHILEVNKGAIITSSFKDLQQGGWVLAPTDTVQSACLGLDWWWNGDYNGASF